MPTCDNIWFGHNIYKHHYYVGIIWESCKINGRRYKQLAARESIQIENAYQQYLMKEPNYSEIDLGRIVIDNKIEVDFKAGK